MSVKDTVLRICNNKVGFLATATTGLDPEKEQLIAVSTIRYGTDVPEAPALYVRLDIPNEQLEPGAEYHRFSSELVRRFGVADGVFTEKLLEELKLGEVTWFTYNTKFQESFLEKYAPGIRLIDLPALVKLADRCMYMDDLVLPLDLVALIQKYQPKAPGFKTMCNSRGITMCEAPGILPVCSNAGALVDLFEKLELSVD